MVVINEKEYCTGTENEAKGNELIISLTHFHFYIYFTPPSIYTNRLEKKVKNKKLK